MSDILANAIAMSRHSNRIDYRAAKKQCVINSDTQMLGMIIDNLIDNASKYSPPDSRVQVSLTRHLRSKERGLRLSVSNEPGDAGWPDPMRLFGKYYRSAHAQRQTGSGMGLYLISGLAKMMGGGIDYMPGKGRIRFVFWLPIPTENAGTVA
jgi:signal transduction histidine kinase